MLSSSNDGNSPSATSPSTQSVTRTETSAPISITTLPSANGIGAIGNQVASTSELALDSSVPVACRWCQAMGSSR